VFVGICSSANGGKSAKQGPKIASDNVGSQLLRKMGYSGEGGLGKHGM